ncbi:MAG: alpha/beta hydrolase [Gammaproteobacteria bacterium]
MYIVTNRKLDESAKGLDIFGSVPSEKGPNELRLVKATQSGTRYQTEVLDDRLTEQEIIELKAQYNLDIDPAQPWYVSLKVACEIMVEAQKQKKHVLFYVHGYNNDLQDIVKTAIALEELYNVMVVPFTWPANGGGALTGTASYLSDKQDARASADALNRFVDKIHLYHKLLTETRSRQLWDKAIKKFPNNQEASRHYYVDLQNRDCKVSINLMCHSMGNYLLKYALMPSDSAAAGLVFDNVSLVAADANNERHEAWVQRLQVRHRVYIVINENDFALKWSRRKPGEAQLARLGHYLKNLIANNAHYLNVTDAAKVKNEHSYFQGSPVQKNPALKKLFHNAFEGGTAEAGLEYRADINAYILK